MGVPSTSRDHAAVIRPAPRRTPACVPKMPHRLVPGRPYGPTALPVLAGADAAGAAKFNPFHQRMRRV
jgi:hypothetical protein